jgi:hypothetical protein
MCERQKVGGERRKWKGDKLKGDNANTSKRKP